MVSVANFVLPRFYVRGQTRNVDYLGRLLRSFSVAPGGYTALRAPDGNMATVLSLVPTAAPFLMMLRISLRPGPPGWQIAASVLLMAATVLAEENFFLLDESDLRG